MKQIITLIILTLTTSCLALIDPLFSTIPSSNNFIDRFPENKKGIVLLKLNSDYLAISWCQASFENEVKDKSCIKLNPSDYYQIIMLEPGWYELQGYKQTNRRFQSVREKEIEPTFSNITGKRKTAPVLAFEVDEGKISFAGHIKFHHVSASGAAQIKDDDFLEIAKLFSAQEQINLLKIFKGHQWEEKIIAKQITENPQILVKNLARTKADFAEQRQIDKQHEREIRKKQRKLLKEKAQYKKLSHKMKSFGSSLQPNLEQKKRNYIH